jgi:hypothetical protein
MIPHKLLLFWHVPDIVDSNRLNIYASILRVSSVSKYLNMVVFEKEYKKKIKGIVFVTR